MKEKYNIIGMSCSACSARIEKSLSSMDNVKNIQVNLLSNSMIVEYDENLLSRDDIVNSVTALGYKAFPILTTKQEYSNNSIKESENTSNKIKSSLIISTILMIILMYVSMGPMTGLPLPTILDMHKFPLNYTFSQFLLTLPIVYLNRDYYSRGVKSLFKLSPNMDSLIALGSASALIFGIIAIYLMSYNYAINNISIVYKYAHNLYFESCAMILTLITIGKYLESRAKQKTFETISKLIEITPKIAHKIVDNNEFDIDPVNILIGDIIKIYPGETIPVDAVVVNGSSSVNESALTGESLPRTVKKGETVLSGSINHSGTLIVKATKVGNDTTLNKIIELVQNASQSKAPIAKLADKIASIFVPLIISISAITFILWIVLGSEIEFALSNAITVLVISCPCALGLATPVAIMVSTGRAYKEGILVKSAEILELASKVDTIIFDKTGTLTHGTPCIVDIVATSSYEDLKNISYSIEKLSNHPFAKSIVEKFSNENPLDLTLTDLNIIDGKGVIAYKNDEIFLAGNLSLVKSNFTDDIIKEISKLDKLYAKEQKTPIYFFKSSTFVGTITLRDELKPESKTLITELLKRKKDVYIISGDHHNVTQAIANKLDIKNYVGNALPQDKYNIIEKLQKNGHVVAMIGDGINDSPALAKSDVSIAIGGGSDIAIETSNIVINNNNVIDIIRIFDLSRLTLKNIKENLFWAFSYNIVCIPIATGMFMRWGLTLNPMIASFAMSISSLFVVTNALRLRNVKLFNIKNIEEVVMETKISVKGMMCSHCTSTVEKLVSSFSGVNSVKANVENESVTIIHSENIDIDSIKNAILDAGYQV